MKTYKHRSDFYIMNLEKKMRKEAISLKDDGYSKAKIFDMMSGFWGYPEDSPESELLKDVLETI